MAMASFSSSGSTRLARPESPLESRHVTVGVTVGVSPELRSGSRTVAREREREKK
jgi:hypothetical protein